MIKNFLIAASLVIASPALVFSQDYFVSFDFDPNGSVATTDMVDVSTGPVSGSAYIFAAAGTNIQAAELNITSSDATVLLLTGGDGVGFDATAGGVTGSGDTGDTVLGPRWNASFVDVDVDVVGAIDPVTGEDIGDGIIDNGSNPGETGRWFGAAINNAQGINPALAAANLDPSAGSVGNLVAQIDFDVLSAGTASIELSLGTQGILLRDGTLADAASLNFGSASLTATGVPEPSSATLLVVGALGMVARRRRARA